jgi:prepilin peptidase CpaA
MIVSMQSRSGTGSTAAATGRMEMKMGNLKEALAFASLLFTDPRSLALIVLLVTAATIDVRSHRIPNWLTLSGTAFGLGYSAFVPFYIHHGFQWSLEGWAVCFALLFPLWMMRIMGAGDVKLMAMAGALLGLGGIYYALVFSFIAGGALAVGFALWHGKLRLMLGNVGRVLHVGSVAMALGMPTRMAMSGWESIGKLPFGLAIASGTITAVVATHFGLI